jgi:hypothetical protein
MAMHAELSQIYNELNTKLTDLYSQDSIYCQTHKLKNSALLYYQALW